MYASFLLITLFKFYIVCQVFEAAHRILLLELNRYKFFWDIKFCIKLTICQIMQFMKKIQFSNLDWRMDYHVASSFSVQRIWKLCKTSVYRLLPALPPKTFSLRSGLSCLYFSGTCVSGNFSSKFDNLNISELVLNIQVNLAI